MMVVKSIIRYIIHRYLKNYIHQLDDEKLNFDLRNGHVILENLHLKPEALADLNFPVTVAFGFLEKLALTIHWMHLYTMPTKVHVQGLYILIVPKNEADQDLTEYHANKMRRVHHKVDDLRKAIIENRKLDEKEMTFFERMRLQIMQNIELVVENLHICYETKSTTKLGHPFSFGVTFRHLELTRAPDAVRKKTRTKDIMSAIYTVKEIKLLSIYWNTKCSSRVNKEFDVVLNDLKSKIATNESVIKNSEMNYILYPVNLDINMSVTITPGEHHFERSTFNINALVQKLTLYIDSIQFSDLLDFVKFQNYSALYERCREYRQLHLLESLGNTMLTQEQQDRIKTLESKLDIYNLAYIRHSVEIEVGNKSKAESSPESDHHSSSKSRWSRLWKKNKTHHDDRETSITSLNLAHHDGYSFHLEDLFNIITNIVIEKLDLYLVSSLSTNMSNREIITFVSIDHGKINIVKRSVSSSLLFQCIFPNFHLYGVQDNISNARLLVQSTSKSSAFPLLNIQFELYPVHESKCDYRFHLSLEPIEIIYDAMMFNRIVERFQENLSAHSFLLAEIKKRTYEEMTSDLSFQKVFDLAIDFKQISLIFPERGLYERNASIIAIDCSRFLLKSSLDENLLSPEEKNGIDRFYVKYTLDLHNFQMKYYPSDGSCLNLSPKISLIAITFLKCIYSDDAVLDDWQIHLKTNTNSSMEISSRSLEILIEHFRSISRISSTLSEIVRRINLYFEIFRPNASIKGTISLDQCALAILMSPLTLIQTNLYLSILKSRSAIENLTIVFNSLMATANENVPPFYLNPKLQLDYLSKPTESSSAD